MYFFLDPSAWAGLFTLIFLEIILSVDNIIFIAILSKKLPYNQRNQARYTGLILALFMRFGLLIIASRLINLTKPIIVSKFFVFSIKEILLLIGGIFLFFKSIFELINNIKNIDSKSKTNKTTQNFWYIVFQIVILDAIFSIDSIMIAVGMINNLLIMISAVTISTILMIFLSQLFIKFINSQKNIIILCLSLLLMISLHLITESLGLYIPKEYLYTAIIFSLFVELMNQIRIRNITIQQSKKPFRKKISHAIFKIIKETIPNNQNKEKNLIPSKYIKNNSKLYLKNTSYSKEMQNKEINIITNALKLSNYSINDIMIPKKDIVWIDITKDYENIKNTVANTSYSTLPICQNKLNEIIGVVPTKKLIKIINNNEDIHNFAIQYPPIIILDILNIINVLHLLRYSQHNMIIISNESGIIQGIIKPVDVFKKIVGKFLDSSYKPEVIINKDNWIVQGTTHLNNLRKILNIDFISSNNSCNSIADFLINKHKKIPVTGTILYYKYYYFHILKSSSYQILLIKITKHKII
ncbi:UPF0053 inner membrane protein YoaE [Buchnera aphidicola (Cinara kochiana kochiana)]|uniref:UPF0053 inner membrane protein YoaE n=1 Tax=Buchnera aphidicola (Cinara kochiana kochiana) TaxID=2518976 RepID=A0A451D5T5_9GAMM|nr:transporter associated domain-containing protein [Buchnera aphidicola]VFP81125.1 UPF0053 inner membrane protein YoaE [Buchnera aphidicola (Cinara kochiana kochiana)]